MPRRHRRGWVVVGKGPVISQFVHSLECADRTFHYPLRHLRKVAFGGKSLDVTTDTGVQRIVGPAFSASLFPDQSRKTLHAISVEPV